MNIQVLSSQECRSLGDALRDLDGKNLIRSDFVLLSANIICNMQLIPVLEKHKFVILNWFLNLLATKLHFIFF